MNRKCFTLPIEVLTSEWVQVIVVVEQLLSTSEYFAARVCVCMCGVNITRPDFDSACVCKHFSVVLVFD